MLRREIKHLPITIIAEDETLLVTEHAQALRHIGEGRFKPQLVLAKALVRKHPGQTDSEYDNSDSANRQTKPRTRKR